MANNGHLYILAGHCSKMEKRLDNLRISPIAIGIGNAAGSEGLRFPSTRQRRIKIIPSLTRILLKT
jgi:hypothetical protein